MKLEVDLYQLLQLKSALEYKKQNINITTDKSINNLLNKESLETIDTLLKQIEKLIYSYGKITPL